MRIRLAVTKSAALCQQSQTWRSFVDLIVLSLVSCHFFLVLQKHLCCIIALLLQLETTLKYYFCVENPIHPWFVRKNPPLRRGWTPTCWSCTRTFLPQSLSCTFQLISCIPDKAKRIEHFWKITSWELSFDLHYWCWTVAQLRVVWHNESKSSSLVSKM